MFIQPPRHIPVYIIYWKNYVMVSHVKAFSLPELKKMALDAGLVNLKTHFYPLEIELEQQLSASFPKPGDADKIRRLVMDDKQGLISRKKGKSIYLTYPIAIITGHKQGNRPKEGE